jgi:hypothetical protein
MSGPTGTPTTGQPTIDPAVARQGIPLQRAFTPAAPNANGQFNFTQMLNTRGGQFAAQPGVGKGGAPAGQSPTGTPGVFPTTPVYSPPNVTRPPVMTSPQNPNVGNTTYGTVNGYNPDMQWVRDLN